MRVLVGLFLTLILACGAGAPSAADDDSAVRFKSLSTDIGVLDGFSASVESFTPGKTVMVRNVLVCTTEISYGAAIKWLLTQSGLLGDAGLARQESPCDVHWNRAVTIEASVPKTVSLPKDRVVEITTFVVSFYQDGQEMIAYVICAQ